MVARLWAARLQEEFGFWLSLLVNDCVLLMILLGCFFLIAWSNHLLLLRDYCLTMIMPVFYANS